MKRKTGEEVSTALKSIFTEIQCILGQPLILKAHSDAGGEFINHQMDALLIEEGLWQTKTAGYDPKGHGRVERYVGILKHRATMFLLHTKMPLAFWFWAMMQAAYEYRCQILDTPLPATAPRFGDRVLIQKPPPHHAFHSKVEEGRFLTLGHNDSTRSACCHSSTWGTGYCSIISTTSLAKRGDQPKPEMDTGSETELER